MPSCAIAAIALIIVRPSPGFSCPWRGVLVGAIQYPQCKLWGQSRGLVKTSILRDGLGAPRPRRLADWLIGCCRCLGSSEPHHSASPSLGPTEAAVTSA